MRSDGKIGGDMRFYLNMDDGVIHDLANEKDQCCIAAIRANACGVGFVHLETAISAGFEPCQYCMEQSDTE